MKTSNWKASGRPQETSKGVSPEYRQWLKRFRLLRKQLKRGINYPDPPSEGFLVYTVSAIAIFMEGFMPHTEVAIAPST